MQPNHNTISKILFWTGILILGFGFVSGLAAGSFSPDGDNEYDFLTTLSVWASYMIPGFLVLGFSEVIRLMQDLRDDLLRLRSRGRRQSYPPGGEGQEGEKPIWTLFGQQEALGNADPVIGNETPVWYPFPRLGKENLFPDGPRAAKYHKLIKRINALEFYFEVEDKLMIEEKLGEVKRLYFEVKHLVFTVGLEHHPIWLNVMEAVRYIEDKAAQMET